MGVDSSIRTDPATLVVQSFRKASQGPLAEFRPAFERLRAVYPHELANESVYYLAHKGLDEIGKKIISWLCSESLYLAPLLDPKLLPIETARLALELFQNADPQFSPKFSKLLSLDSRDSNAFILPRALELLIGLRNYEIFVPHLQALVKSSDVYVRSKAVKALCRIRPSKSLIERHSQSEDARVRANALEAIWHIKTDEAKSILEGSVADEDHRVALNALVGLYFLGEPTALERMIQMAKHDSIRFRRAIVWALGLIADSRAKAALEKMLSDPSPIIQTNASRALAKLPAEPLKVLVENCSKPPDVPLGTELPAGEIPTIPEPSPSAGVSNNVIHLSPPVFRNL